MSDRKNNVLQELLRLVTKLFIGVISLLLVRSIVLALPMVKELSFLNPLLSFTEWANAIISTLIIAVILKFAVEVECYLRTYFPVFPEIGYIAKWLAVLVCVVIGYKAYYYIAKIFLEEALPIYYWIFLVLAAIPVIKLIRFIYENVDNLANLAIKKAVSRKASSDSKQLKCHKCGSLVSGEQKFCADCGALAEREKSGFKPKILQCPKCNSEISAEAHFCKECGSKIKTEG